MHTTDARCLEHGSDCKGEVTYHLIGNAEKAWPRCDHHAELRWERYWDSMERYADCDLAPGWFDPAYAGERWDDDY